MDSGSECSVLESVEDNGDVRDDLNCGESLLLGNFVELFSEKENGIEFSPSPSVTEKGKGLRKWKRIQRVVNKVGESGGHWGELAIHNFLVLGVSSTKRAEVYVERNQRGEDSASSTNAVDTSLGGFPLLGGFPVGPSFAVETDSDDSEDLSSKSSTAASAPKMKQVRMVSVSSHDKSRTSSIDRLTHSVQDVELEKGRTETSKKARMGRVKIEKENSHSSVESDLRRSNFVFVQGTCSMSNGVHGERWLDSDVEHGEGAQCSEREVGDGVKGGYAKECLGAYEGMSKNEVVESYPEVKEETSNSHSSSTNQDPVIDSVAELQSTHDALKKELLKFKEIEDFMPSSEGTRSFAEAVQSGVSETVNEDLETECEVIIKQMIEAEIKLLAVSNTVDHLRSVAADQLPVSDKPEVSGPDKNQLDFLKTSENKAEKLEMVGAVIATADETLKLQKRVCKYTSCFFVQLVLLAVILAIFILEITPIFILDLTPNYVDVVPT